MDSKQEQLKKVLLLEKQKGCQDKAVIGGLDGYLRRLQAAQDGVLSLSKDGLPELRSLLDTRYGALSPAQRERWLDRVLAALAGEGGALSPDKSKPKNARPGPQHSLARAPSPEVPRKPPSVCHPERSEGSVPGKRGAPSVRHKGETDSSVASLPQNDSPGPKPSPDPQGDSPVTVLSGVRSHLAAKLAKLGVSTLRDLLYFFPRRHVDYSQVRPIAQLEIEVEQTVVGFVWEAAVKHLGRTGRGTEAIIGDDTGNLKARWYHQPYLAAKLRPNTRVALSGKIAIFRGQKVLESPELELLEGEELIHTGRLVPIYPLTEGLSPRTVRRLTKEALDRYGPSWPDFLPREIKEQAHPSTGSGVALSPSKGHGLLDLPQALRQAHFPDSLALKDEARQRLAFDELFLIQLGMIGRKREWQEGQRAPVLKGDRDALQSFLSSLPFPLTPAQERVMKEIRDDLSRDRPMSRLLQGEVGSGKTVVATAALLLAATSGYQASFMAPTEILAEQHFQSLGRLLSGVVLSLSKGLPHPAAEGYLLSIRLDPWPRPILLGLLTGGLKEREKDDLRGLIAQGSVDIVIGTHALIEGDVEFAKLGLAVIDEQHRFGVMQRSALRQKGSSPHMLAMTATPIPRTLALTLYGDLDLSVLDQLPPGRQEIKTRWLRPDQREGAYEFVRRQAAQGRQAFVICPLIEESEAIEAKAAVTEYQRLSQEVFPDLRLGLLHGRMPAAEKEEAMRRFRAGEMDVLVSTPVVEVGIDVPNATVMLVEGADRFGLSQLHQFRGRVGRGEHPSYCILLAQSPSLEGVQRLKVLEETRDGFALAEEDLKLRGPGEFFGTRQSGLPDLRMARLSDAALLELARREALHLLELDPELKKPEHQALAQELARLWKNTTEEMS